MTYQKFKGRLYVVPVEDPQEGFQDLARERSGLAREWLRYRSDMDDLACRSFILKGLSDWLCNDPNYVQYRSYLPLA